LRNQNLFVVELLEHLLACEARSWLAQDLRARLYKFLDRLFNWALAAGGHDAGLLDTSLLNHLQEGFFGSTVALLEDGWGIDHGLSPLQTTIELLKGLGH
jgi:hypothetical protein